MSPTQRGDASDQGKAKLFAINYHPKAVGDLERSIIFYDNRQPGLGLRFIRIYERTISHIRTNPTTWKKDNRGRYRIGLRKFPFIVIYRIVDGEIYILAIAHTSKRPGYWIHRDQNQ